MKFSKYGVIGNCTRDDRKNVVVDHCVKCNMEMHRYAHVPSKPYCIACERNWMERGKKEC